MILVPGCGHRRARAFSHKATGLRLAMTTATWVTMIVICAFVWGGFTLAVTTAFRKESGKLD